MRSEMIVQVFFPPERLLANRTTYSESNTDEHMIDLFAFYSLIIIDF